MTKFSGFRRSLAVALSGALLATTFQPASAAPLPMSRDLGASSPVEMVQYRRGYRPAYAPVRRKRGGDGAAAAALAIGALAIGAAAIASQNRRERVYYDDPGYYGGGYAPAPVYEPQYYSAPGYYAPPPRRYLPPQGEVHVYRDGYDPFAPRHQFGRKNQPAIDGGSPYAVQQQRVQNREAWRQWRRSQGY